jgi:tetratricopeptide (TPR) repeat protein
VHGVVEPPAREGDAPSAVVLPRLRGYEKVRFVAFGGFGLVFEASPEGSSSRVAIKLAREDRTEARHRLAEEIRVLTEVGPPHVPAVLDRGRTSGGTPYVVMEYLGDTTLAARLADRAEPLGAAEAIDVSIAILRALEAVHERGYVHCDLKPENIFEGPSGRVTLIDFGLVIGTADGTGWMPEVTGEGPVMGTSEYMSPEQCSGRVDIDLRTDVYAMGVILQELLTGRPPFWGPRAAVREMHLSHRPPRLSVMAPDRAIPPALEEIVARCLAKERRARFASARDLRRALEAARGATAGSEPLPPAAPEATGDEGESAGPSRLTAGVVFFLADADPIVLSARIQALGGQIAYGGGGRHAAVFAQGPSDNPARRALLAAEELVRSGLCSHARVDLAPVTAHVRRDGTRRFWSPLFAHPERYPSSPDARVLVAPAAAAVLPDSVAASAPGSVAESRAERRHFQPGDEPPSPWPLFGRDEIMDALLASARETARGGSSAVVTVTGELGMGKSHLFRELARRLAAREPDAALLALRAREPGLGDPDRTLVEILRRGQSFAPGAQAAAGTAATEIRAASGGEGGSERSELLALALGGAPAGEGAGDALRNLGAAPGALRSAVISGAGEALRKLAAARPLLVLIDDAHFAGDATLSALEYAALAEAGAPVWVCALGRPALVEEHRAWGARAGRREARSLGPLDQASAEALCRTLLVPVDTVPGSAVERLVARAQATPLLLVELVRGLHREGIVRRSPKGESWYVATDELERLPSLPLVEWLAQGEIEGLAPALRGHARLLALLGDHVSEEEIAGAVRCIDEQGGGGELPLDAKVATRRLLSAGLIVRDRELRFTYRHALVREMLARSAPESFRRLVHLAAARYYRTAESIPDRQRLPLLALHASAAGLAEEAARTFFVLAERARAWHAYVEAEHLYSRVLDQPGLSVADQAAARRGRGLMRYRLARYHDALDDLSFARTAAEDEGDTMAQIEILLDEATVLDWMDEFATSEARVRQAEALTRLGSRTSRASVPPSSGPEASDFPPLVRARLLLGLGRSAMRFSRNDEAAELLQLSAAAADPLGDEGYETLVIALLLLGFLLPGLRRREDARRALERTIALCEAHGDRLHLGAALNTRALLWGGEGDKERMVADMQRSLAMARELGQGSLELIGEFNLGEHLLLMDDPAAAAPHIARALALDLQITGHPGRAVVALLEARLQLHLGDVERASAITGLIRARQDDARARGEPDTLMAPSDDVICCAIELWAADAPAVQWDELEAWSDRFSLGQERIEVIEARAAAAQRAGRTAEARSHLARAVELANAIPNAMSSRLARRLAELERIAG